MFDIVSTERASLLVAKGVAVIDVREPGEWEQGHIPGARLMSLATLRAGRASLPARGVLLVCARGMRSQTAARVAAEQGIPVYSLAGGMHSWVQAGLPVTTKLSVAV